MSSESLVSNDPECVEFIIKKKRKRRTNSAVDRCLGFNPPAEISISSPVEFDSFNNTPLVKHNPPAIEPQISQLARASSGEDLDHRTVTVEDFLRKTSSAPAKRKKQRHIDLGNSPSLAFDADKTSSSETSAIQKYSSSKRRSSRSGIENNRKSRTKKFTDRLIQAAVLSHVNIDMAFQTTSEHMLPPPLEFISANQLPSPVGRRCTRWKLVNPKKTIPFDRELSIILQPPVDAGTVSVPLKPMTLWKRPLESRHTTQIITRTAPFHERRASLRPKYPPIQFISVEPQKANTTNNIIIHKTILKGAAFGAKPPQNLNPIESSIFDAPAVLSTIEHRNSDVLKHTIKQVRFSSPIRCEALEDAPFRCKTLEDAPLLVLARSRRTSGDGSVFVTSAAEGITSPKLHGFSLRSALSMNTPYQLTKQLTTGPSDGPPNDHQTANTLEETSPDISAFAALPIICSSLSRSDTSKEYLDEVVSRSPAKVVSDSVVKPMKTLGKFFDTFTETARRAEASVSTKDIGPSQIEAHSKLDVPTNRRLERNRSLSSHFSTIHPQNNRQTFSNRFLPVTSISHTPSTKSGDSYARRSFVETLDSQMLLHKLSNSRLSVENRIKPLSNLDLFNNDSRIDNSVLSELGAPGKHNISLTTSRFERQRKRREPSVTSEKEKLETEETKNELGICVNFFAGL